jgi:hypothetical protein
MSGGPSAVRQLLGYGNENIFKLIRESDGV